MSGIPVSIPLIMVVLLNTARMLVWMGGADAKVQAGLLGALLLAGMLVLVEMGIAGEVAGVSRKARLPAVAVIAFSALMTMIVEISIALLVRS